ncbi:hypothetical protein MTP99_003721 [Tenebrio molitor]|nr:hypothetical protein MTP99_003721 [Tenebrio molitor]
MGFQVGSSFSRGCGQGGSTPSAAADLGTPHGKGPGMGDLLLSRIARTPCPLNRKNAPTGMGTFRPHRFASSADSPPTISPTSGAVYFCNRFTLCVNLYSHFVYLYISKLHT